MHDRAGNVKNDIEGRGHANLPPDASVFCCNCGRALDHNVLFPDGTTIVCCMDYGMENIFGNLFTQSYTEILTSANASRLRYQMESEDCLCKHCTNAYVVR